MSPPGGAGDSKKRSTLVTAVALYIVIMSFVSMNFMFQRMRQERGPTVTATSLLAEQVRASVNQHAPPNLISSSVSSTVQTLEDGPMPTTMEEAIRMLQEERRKNMMGVKQTGMMPEPEKVKAHLDLLKNGGTNTEHLLFGKYVYEKKDDMVDYEGNDVAEVGSGDMEVCAEKCNSMDNCAGIALNIAGGACWLKSTFEGTGVTGRQRTNYIKKPASAAVIAAHAQLQAKKESEFAAAAKEDAEIKALHQRGDLPQPPKGMMCDYLINIFTTFITDTKDTRKIAAQENVLKAFERLRPYGMQAWLFTDSKEWAQKALERHVLVVSDVEKNEKGTPLLGFMYKHVLNATEEHRQSCAGIAGGGGVGGGALVFDGLNSDKDVETKSSHGALFQNDAEDYFIYSRGAREWEKMPAFVVGRRAYDNWLVDNAFHDDKMDLIDASNTILALHLTASDGNKAGHAKGADNNHNVEVVDPVTQKQVGPHQWDHGRTDHCHFFTKHRKETIEVIVRSGNAGGRQVPSS